jgi:hypothetical protein
MPSARLPPKLHTVTGPGGSEHVAQVGTVRGVGEDRALEIGCAKPRPDGEREEIDQLLRLRAEQMRTEDSSRPFFDEHFESGVGFSCSA